VVDGVGDCCSDADETDLADTLGAKRGEGIGFSDERDIDLRNVGVDGNEVVAERGVGDASGGWVGDCLFEQGLSDAADGPADDLTAGGLLVEDSAGVDDRCDACDADEPEVSIDTDLDELGRERT
jgi:hypothetical protein